MKNNGLSTSEVYTNNQPKNSASLRPLGPGCVRVYEALKQRGTGSAEQIKDLMPEGCQDVRSVRARLSELRQRGLVEVVSVQPNALGHRAQVYRAVQTRDMNLLGHAQQPAQAGTEDGLSKMLHCLVKLGAAVEELLTCVGREHR